MPDTISFYQRYLKEASQELAIYFHADGVVSCNAEPPTREQLIASIMAHEVIEFGSPSQPPKRRYRPTREQAERTVDGAAERAAIEATRCGPWPRPRVVPDSEFKDHIRQLYMRMGWTLPDA